MASPSSSSTKFIDKVPTSEIKNLCTTLKNNFHTPSPHSSKKYHSHHYHIFTEDFNSWVDTEQEEHFSNHSGFPHIPLHKGGPDPKHEPQGRVPNSTSITTHARARSKMLLDFLNHHTLIIAIDRFLSSSKDPTSKIQLKHPPFSPHLPTTIHKTIVDYFTVSKFITPDIAQCSTHFNAWHSLPPIHPTVDETPGKRYPVRTDQNMIWISFLLPSHPPLGSNNLSDDQRPTRQACHSWKLKYGKIQQSLKEDLDFNAATILPTLKDILKNTKNLPKRSRKVGQKKGKGKN